MSRNASAFPTDLELEILKVLWRDGPSTVRQVREALAETRDLAYTTVMTIMGIMVKKKYIRRRKSKNAFVYRAIWSEQKTSQGMLRDVVDRLFDGSTAAVMEQLLDSSELDDQELLEIKRLVQRRTKRGES